MQHLYGRSAEVIYLGGFGRPQYQEDKLATLPIELLTVSRLQSSKRIDWILYTLAGVKRDASQYPAWRLHIVGSGPDREALQQLSNTLQLGDAVVFHGFVTDEQLKNMYATAHVFLMPARQGYGLPAIEAMYQKLGLVLSEESGVVELLDDTNWVTVARGGKEGFAKATKEMLLRVVRPDFHQQSLPDLPTEEIWAKKIIGSLGW